MKPFFFLLILLPCIVLGQETSNPPEVKGSYKATGELFEAFDDNPEFSTQAAFEENFDASTGNSVFTVWQLGLNITFVEDGLTNQTLQYNASYCTVITKEEWIKVDAPPSLLGYLSTSGNIKFALRFLLNLDNKYLDSNVKNVSDTYRNLPAKKWLYTINGAEEHANTKINVYAYWSDPNWMTTNGARQVPLGFKIEKLVTEKGEKAQSRSQYVSVFSFVEGIVDKKVFLPREGIFCPERNHPFELPKFPTVKSFSFRSEFVLVDYQTVKNMEVWFDIDNGFLRVDLDRLDDQSTTDFSNRIYSRQITSKQLDVTFRIDAYKGIRTCKVIPIDDYDFDVQELINPKLELDQWNIHALLGENAVQNYVYLGKTYKRNIPCHMYQAYRDDWPDPSYNISSVWEWCLSVKLTDDDEILMQREHEVGLVSASITIVKSTNVDFDEGYRMVHHFYDAINEDPQNMSVNTFDVDYCFSYSAKEKLFLQVTLNETVTDENRDIFEGATSDLTFLWLWKSAVVNATGIPDYSLRITGLESFIFKNMIFVEFKLLDVHKDLPASAKKGQPSLDDAYKALKKAVDNGKFAIAYALNSKGRVINLKGNSIKPVFDRSFVIEDVTTITESASTPAKTTDFSLVSVDITSPSVKTSPDSSQSTSSESSQSTSSDSSQSTSSDPGSSTPADSTVSGKVSPTDSGATSTPPPIEKPDIKYSGHQPGAVAGVSIAMLVVGITIGAGGTFYKFRGVPTFLRFR